MIKVDKLTKIYYTGDKELRAVNEVSFEIKEGEFVSITGRSGSGKSTLLYQLGLLDRPTYGEILIDGKDVSKLSSQERTIFRLENLGYVFQDYALLPELTALENVILPLMASEEKWDNIKEKGSLVLEQVGLGERLNNYPSQLSGGEKQRVAIARAIVNGPKILFADEPTANLDSKRADEIINLLFDLNKRGLTIMLVTHEEKYIQRADRIIKISDGMIKEEKRPEKI